VADGDKPDSGMSLGMAEVMESIFPFAKRSTKADDIRMKLHGSPLRDDQKVLILDLLSINYEIAKHFDVEYRKLRKEASLEEISSIGNDQNETCGRQIASLIHERFCRILGKIFADGFHQGFFFWTNYNPLDFVRAAATQRQGDYAPAAFSTAELEVGRAVASIDLNDKLPPPKKLSGFLCEGLMSRSLSSWIKVLLSNEYELDQWYDKDSVIRVASALVVEALQELDGLPFILKYVSDEQG